MEYMKDNLKNSCLAEENESLRQENIELQEWKRKLSLILEYSAKINTSNDIREILQIIADETKAIVQAERCTVFLYDHESNELYSWVAHGLEEAEVRLSADKGIAGHVFRTGKTVNVKDVYKDKRFNVEIDKVTGYKTKSMLCMPLRDQMGYVIGVFQVLNKQNGGFTEQDEEILGLLVQQSGAIVESAILYDELKKSFSSFIYTLAEAIDARDPMTAGHSQRVCEYSVLMAREMGYPENSIDVLRYAALLHDLGKIGVKEAVLTKPGKLDVDEYEHIQTHTKVTRKILDRTYFQPKFRDIPEAASSHHENVDGTGYPNRLKGESIPKMARIMSVADVFDALTCKRHYREPMTFQNVVEHLLKKKGSKFDPDCVDIFMKLKLFDIMKIMTKKAKNEVPDSARRMFNGITVEKFYEKLQAVETGNGSNSKVIEAFNKYYPADFEL